MRVSTSQIYNTGINGIVRNQASMSKTQNQISTGRRVLTPADDPVASARALVVTQSQQVNQRYLENQGKAGEQLRLTEGTLQSATNLMQNILERTIQAGNGTLGDANREQIARELRQRYDELTALANTQDGEGNYLFAGGRSTTQPFPASALTNAGSGTPVPGVTLADYAGDDSRRTLQVEASRVMPISEPGSDVFVRIRDKNGNPTGESVFTTLGNFIESLETSPYVATGYGDTLGKLQAVLDNTSRVRTAVGARLSELESLQATSEDRDIQYQSTLSDLQDLDYADAISRLSQQQILLEAAQKSFLNVTSLGLFKQI